MSARTVGAALAVVAPMALFGFTLIAPWSSPNPGWRLNNPGFNDVQSGTTAQQDAAIQAASATWGGAAQGCAPFSFTFQGASSVANVAFDDQQVVMVRDAAQGNALATTFTWTQGSRLAHFDMVFWDGAIVGVPGNGDVMSGGGVVAGNLDGAPGVDLALASVDNWSGGDDYWRIAIGTSCANGACTWSAPQGVEAGAAVMSSTALAGADFDSDGRLDLFLTGIDNWDRGLDYWRYRLGTGCGGAGTCTWSPVRTVDSGAAVLTGGGVAIGQLDADPRPDVFLVGIDSWDQGLDYWRYRIGMNCDAQGLCAWSQVQGLPAGGAAMSGGGVAIGDLDGDGRPEVVVAGIDNWDQGLDYWRYRIGTGCAASGACTWSDVQAVGAGAALLVGGGVALADLTGDGRPEVVLAGLDRRTGLDDWRYAVGTACSAAAGTCTWAGVRTAASGGDVVGGGGVVAPDLDGDGRPDLVLTGIDNWNQGPDYWRYRVGTSCQGSGACNWGFAFSPTGAPGAFDIQSVATHEFGHAAGLQHTNVGGAVMACAIGPGTLTRTLGCDDVEGLQELYSTSGTCGGRGVSGVASGGAALSGGGIAVGDVDGVAGPEVVLTGTDDWSGGPDYWRLAVGTRCASGTCSWAAPVTIQAGADVMSSSAVALSDFDGDGRQDIFLSGIDNWNRGLDYWRFRVGTGCDAAGACRWSQVQTLDSGADVLSGGGVTAGQLDADRRPDVVIAALDNWNQGLDYWRYRIGMNCDAAGQCAWTDVQGVEAGGDILSGGGVALGDLDADGTPEIILFAIDNWAGGDDYWRYRIGSACNTTTGSCTWSPIQSVSGTSNLPTTLCGAGTGGFIPNNAAALTGGGIALANVQGDARPEILVAAIEPFAQHDYWRYVIGSSCSVSSGACTWSPARVSSSGAWNMRGGGVAAMDVDGNGSLDVVLSGIDDWDGGLDYWRVRARTAPCGP